MRHKWMNAHDLEHENNEAKSICERCGLMRLRLSYLRGEQNVIYYHPTLPKLTTYKAPKCKAL
jgi:hypothetical protein